MNHQVPAAFAIDLWRSTLSISTPDERSAPVLSRTERTLSSIILLVVAIVTLYPIVVLVTTSFDKVNDNNSGISFFKSLSFSSFKYAWTQGGFSQLHASTRRS